MERLMKKKTHKYMYNKHTQKQKKIINLHAMDFFLTNIYTSITVFKWKRVIWKHKIYAQSTHINFTRITG